MENGPRLGGAADLGSQREMIYHSREDVGRRRVRNAGGGNSLSQGRDHVDRTDGICEGHDSIGGPEVDGLSATAISGGNGGQVLSGKSPSGGTDLRVGTGGGMMSHRQWKVAMAG